MIEEEMMARGGGGGGGGGMNRGGGRGGRGGRGGGGGGGGGHDRSQMQNRSQDDRLMERIMTISGPTHELPIQDCFQEKKFSGRNRLYIGNLTNDISEDEIQQMFSPFGETSELFINKEKNFAFLRMVRKFFMHNKLFTHVLAIFKMITKITV